MGTWGTRVVVRSGSALDQLAPLAGVVWEDTWERPDGWRSGFSSDLLSEVAEALGAETGAPCLLALVADSDQVVVTLVSSSSAAFLLGTPYDVEELADDPVETVAVVVQWAVAAGLAVPPALALYLLVTTRRVLAEDALADLLDLLGLSAPGSAPRWSTWPGVTWAAPVGDLVGGAGPLLLGCTDEVVLLSPDGVVVQGFGTSVGAVDAALSAAR